MLDVLTIKLCKLSKPVAPDKDIAKIMKKSVMNRMTD